MHPHQELVPVNKSTCQRSPCLWSGCAEHMMACIVAAPPGFVLLHQHVS